MESIEQMIKRLCPEGVEYKSFSVIGTYVRGITYNKAQENNTGDGEGWKVFRANNITLSSNTLNFDDVKIVNKNVKVKDSQMLKRHDILICAGSGSKDHIGKVAYINEDMNYTFGGFMGVLRVDEDMVQSRYLFHVLTSRIFKDYLSETLNSSTINNLNSQIMNDLVVPLPPMEIQTRIVEVLDKMTSLTAELEAELEARKQQYEYYRNKLLSFNEIGGGTKQVAWRKISEIAQYPKARIKSEMLTVNTYVGVESLIKDRGGKTSSSSVPDGTAIEFLPQDILIGNIRPYLKKIWFSDCQGGTNGDVVCIRVLDCNEVMPKFLYYILASDTFFDYDNSHAKGGKMPRGDKNAILAYNVPVPSMEEQERIVSILDRFETLTNDLQNGLPAEIEARRQQYEYYRNKLLTFDKIA